MINHKLTEEQAEFQKLARDLASKEIRPRLEHLDNLAPGVFPQDLFQLLFESGLINTALPESAGGLGLGLADQVVIAQQLSWGDNGLWGSIEASQAAQQLVLQGGSTEQIARYLAPLNQSPTLAGHAIASAIKPARVFYKQVDDSFYLTGRNVLMANAGFEEFYLIEAVEDRRGEDSSDGRANTLFLVPRGIEGLTFADPIKSLGRRAMPLALAELDDVELNDAHIIGGIGGASSVVLRARLANLTMQSAGYNGLARAALDHAVQYAKDRTTFGVPIGNHQGIAFMLADMAKDIQASELLTAQAAQLVDQGCNCQTQALAAFAFAQEMAGKCAEDAVQVFGGYGFSREYPVEKLMRDCKAARALGPSADIIKAEIGKQLVTAL